MSSQQNDTSYPTKIKDIRMLAETVGAIQDTIRIHADALNQIHEYLYASIISLDLIFMELVQLLPKEDRKDILQNDFDDSLSGLENDVVALSRIKEYVEKRLFQCREAIKNYDSSPTKVKEENKDG